jgi:hypothetical protein
VQRLDEVDEQLVGILLTPHAELPVERLEVAGHPDTTTTQHSTPSELPLPALRTPHSLSPLRPP